MSVTRNEMAHAASMVKAIAAGQWTDEPPDWVDTDNLFTLEQERAIQTAEAFIVFFAEFNPRFDLDWFLVACGLKDDASVCSNCGQFVRSGDCLNECHKRGLAKGKP